jgi:hypothetical protein
MFKQQSVPSAHQATISRDDLTRVVGEIEDAKVIDILALKPTMADVEEAAIWAIGDGDVLAKAGRPLIGISAEIFEILTADEEEPPPTR